MEPFLERMHKLVQHNLLLLGELGILEVVVSDRLFQAILHEVMMGRPVHGEVDLDMGGNVYSMQLQLPHGPVRVTRTREGVII